MSTSTPSTPIALGLCSHREIESAVVKAGKGKSKFTQNILLATDFALVGISGLAVCYFRFVFNIPTAPIWNLVSRALFGRHMAFVLLYAVLFVLFAHARKLYTESASNARNQQVIGVLKSSASAAFIVISAIYLAGANQIASGYIGVTVIVSSLLLAARGFRTTLVA